MKARDQDKGENQSNGEAPLPAVSANTLARCLGVTPKIIYDLTKEGVIERSSGRLFQLEDSVRRYSGRPIAVRATLTWWFMSEPPIRIPMYRSYRLHLNLRPA